MFAQMTVHTGNGESVYAVSTLEATSIILARNGFYDIDIEPDVHTVRLTASSKGAKISATGKTVAEACEKLIGRIVVK